MGERISNTEKPHKMPSAESRYQDNPRLLSPKAIGEKVLALTNAFEDVQGVNIST